MSRKTQNQKVAAPLLGPLCQQLVTMATNARSERTGTEISDENLTHLVSSGNKLDPNEQNPHEDHYRKHYEA